MFENYCGNGGNKMVGWCIDEIRNGACHPGGGARSGGGWGVNGVL